MSDFYYSEENVKFLRENKENIEKYLKEIIEVGKKYGFSLSHQDWNGAFLVEKRKEASEEERRGGIRWPTNDEWLMQAADISDLKSEDELKQEIEK
jgi:hypothetical protein